MGSEKLRIEEVNEGREEIYRVKVESKTAGLMSFPGSWFLILGSNSIFLTTYD